MIITQEQWQFIMMELLGLRSGSSTEDINSAASYAMDCGKDFTFPFPLIPENWDQLLFGTINHMQEFDGYKNRFLLIISKSTSDNFEYSDCFPKCSVKPTKVFKYISLDNPIAVLVQWVADNIPVA